MFNRWLSQEVKPVIYGEAEFKNIMRFAKQCCAIPDKGDRIAAVNAMLKTVKWSLQYESLTKLLYAGDDRTNNFSSYFPFWKNLYRKDTDVSIAKFHDFRLGIVFELTRLLYEIM